MVGPLPYWLTRTVCLRAEGGKVIEMSSELKYKIPRYGLEHYSTKMTLTGDRQTGRQTRKQKTLCAHLLCHVMSHDTITNKNASLSPAYKDKQLIS